MAMETLTLDDDNQHAELDIGDAMPTLSCWAVYEDGSKWFAPTAQVVQASIVDGVLAVDLLVPGWYESVEVSVGT